MKRGRGLSGGKGLSAKGGLSRGSGLKAKKKVLAKGRISKQSNSLLTKADRLFSRYVRRSRSVDGSLSSSVLCYTCPIVLPGTQMQCGHFVGRSRLDVRFNEDNARPQCPTCNVTKAGNLEVYEARLVAEIGEEKVNALKKIDLSFTLTDKYLKGVIKKYEDYLNNPNNL